jgi:predicted nucleotide-binding protein
MLKALGHTGFDRFLLELDLPDRSVGKGNGLWARATSLAKYAINNPEQLTPERRTVAYEIIRRATQLYRDGVQSNLGSGERVAFAAAMRGEGHASLLSEHMVHLKAVRYLPASAEDILSSGETAEASQVKAVADEIGRQVETLSRKVFIVHGHDEAAREAVARFLEKIGFEVVILHEQVNRGRTIIEKFEASGDVGFVVVLLTPDDEGGKVGATAQKRARQNVILEWGYFIGRLGRSRVCALKKGDVELPSDILGIVWETFDEHDAWKRKLAKELEGAGFQIDWQKAGRS